MAGSEAVKTLTTSNVVTPTNSALYNGLDTAFSPDSAYGNFLMENYNMSIPDYLDMSLEARQALDAQSLAKGFEGSTQVSNDWFGIEGSNTASIGEGLGAISAGYDIYQNIIGADQKKEKFGKDMQILDQQIALNDTVMKDHTDSRDAFRGTTFRKEPTPGLGTIG